MASGPITSWEIDGGTVETVSDFILRGSKITSDGDCSHEIKRHSLEKKLWQTEKHIKKERHFFTKKGLSSQSYDFSSSQYGCENWIIKKAECWIIDFFELWCWRRLLRVPWTARRSTQSILKGINLNIHWKDWCWSWNSNTLATWCEELTHL